MRDILARPVMWGIALGLVLLAVFVIVDQLTTGRTAKTEAKLGRNTTAAAIGSGKDAVATVGARTAAESNLDKEVGHARQEIDAAPDAAAADAAGRDGLCRVAGGQFCEHPVH